MLLNELIIMNRNDEPEIGRQEGGSLDGCAGKSPQKSAGKTFNFYVKNINQCLDLILKLSPVFMLGAGFMLWSFLREIGWAHLLLPTASSPSGLAFLAISAVVFVGAVIVVFLSPSLLLSPGFDLYEGGSIPARVKWILVGFSVLWMAIFAAIELLDGFLETIRWHCVFGGIYAAGIVGYAAPGFRAACKACEDLSSAGLRNGTNDKDIDRLWRTTFRDHWLAPCSGIAMPEPVDKKGEFVSDRASPLPARDRKSRVCFAWLRPFWVVFMALISAVATSSPLLVLIKLWGYQLESNLGTALALTIVLLCAGLAVIPAFIYLHERSKDESPAVAAKYASLAAGGLVYLCLFAMMYAPIRDRVFHLLDIQSSQEEYFLVSSPVATSALSMLEFPLISMPTSVSGLHKWRASKEQDATNLKNGIAVAAPEVPIRDVLTTDQRTGTTPDGTKPLKVLVARDTPMIVRAWVGYSFGDTVLLCKWRTGGAGEKRDVSVDDGHSRNNVCLPLARSELRRLPPVWSQQ